MGGVRLCVSVSTCLPACVGAPGHDSGSFLLFGYDAMSSAVVAVIAVDFVVDYGVGFGLSTGSCLQGFMSDV